MSSQETVLTRAAIPEDAAALVDVRELMLREMGICDEPKLASLREKSVPLFAEWLGDGRMAGFIVEQGDQVLGGVTMNFQQLQPQLNAQSGRVANIFGLYVVPAERNQGLATSLVRRCMELARVRGVELVTLHAAPQARPIYERLGFEPTAEMRYFVR